MVATYAVISMVTVPHRRNGHAVPSQIVIVPILRRRRWCR